jgi:1-acyl-sn-glycerol-3-phosphate acyltransferase
MSSQPNAARPDTLNGPSLGLFIFGHIFLRLFARWLCRVRYEGSNRLPPTGAHVVVANHRSFMDPPLVGMHLNRTLCYFARANLWKYPVIGQVLRIVGGIPVDRQAPTIETMKTAVETLKSGRNLLIFPEGTRTRTGRLGVLREGPALFARRAGVPVVPVYLYESERLWPQSSPLPRLCSGARVIFGPVVRAPERLPPKLQDRLLTVWIERWMRRQEARCYAAAGRR